MRTGVSYFGPHNPRHLAIDLREMQAIGLDDVLLAAQENDFIYFRGKLEHTPRLAREHGLRPIIIFWGALNLFGGGRSSQFLLDHPEAFQVARDGAHLAGGCYVNPLCRMRIQEMIDEAAACGFAGYFIDEPTLLRECYCPSCREQYGAWYAEDLIHAGPEALEVFRQRCAVDYVAAIAGYCKARHPELETMCCLMPWDETLWEAVAAIEALDNLGTDLYWVNSQRRVEEMVPPIARMRELCATHGKRHHQWLQCWMALQGYEQRILDQGRILVREHPDALYVWGWQGQIGTSEACEDPPLAWARALQVLQLAKQSVS